MTINTPTSPLSSKRSPRYWQIYQFIAGFIKRYRIGPTKSEIKTACGITANGVLDYWLDKLKQDGRIIRRPRKHRGIRLPAPRRRNNLWLNRGFEEECDSP